MTPDNQSDQSPVHQFVSTATGTLIKLIAIKLRAAVANGDTVLDLDPHPRQSTKFEAQSKPGMSVHAYLTRVITLTPIPADAVLLSLVYLNRISSPGSLNEDDRPSLFSYLPKDLQDQYDAEATVRNFDQDTGTSHQDERSHESDQGLRNQSTAPSCQPQTPLLICF
ncbi:hypothetical protein BY996DRAFT_4083179 [Phakopsora pachyrhizi]|nr:hypothetical protein BY996DRAFT_4083179 [Phakopsora pachyrhizi]